jgi:hypothetical protein
MSIRIIPLLIIAYIFYNLIVLFGGGADAQATLSKGVLTLPLMRKPIQLTWGDLIILLTMILLFVELIKSTFTSTSAMVDHGLSMLLFIACLVQFLISESAASSVFFFIMIACLIDVVAGFSIGMRTARRDLNIGTDN